MKQKQFNHRRSYRVPVIIGAIIVVLGLAAVAYLYTQNSQDNKRIEQTAPYTPPTAEEKEAANTQKDETVKETEQNNTPPSSANIVVDAGQYNDTIEVRAYAANVFESGGTCTATLKYGDATITRQVTAFESARTTQCKGIDIPRSEFKTAGDWQLTVSYSSPTISGQSAPITINIK